MDHTSAEQTHADRARHESPPDAPSPVARSTRPSLLRDPVPWLVLAAAFGADQLTKLWVVTNLERGESIPETGFFRFTHAWNTGTAFGLFQDFGGVFTVVSFIAVALLFWIYRSAARPSLLVRVAFGLQLGGAFGNLLDRLRLGHVTDFVDVGPWPIFNVADSSIVVGIALMAIYFWGDRPHSEAQATVDAGNPPHKGTPPGADSDGTGQNPGPRP